MHKKTGIICLACLMIAMVASCDGLEPSKDARHDSVLVSLLTPESSEVITSVEDLLILDCTLPLADLIRFYETILFDLGAEETGLNDKREGIWIYSGIYERTKPITIEMRDNVDSVRVYVIY